MIRFRVARMAVLSLLATGLALPATGAASAAPATLYVDSGNASCSDQGTGTAAVPYCSLQTATDAAQPGETVQVKSGGSYPATTVTTSGAPGAPLTISGTGIVSIAALTFSGVHDVVLQRLDVNLSTGGVRVQDSSAVTLTDVHVVGPQSAPAVEVSGRSSDVTVSRSLIESDAENNAVRVDAGVQRTTVTTNRITSGNFTGTAVELDAAVDTAVTSNTFSYTAHALSVTAGSTGTTAENNLLEQNDIQVSADSAAQSRVGYNLFSHLPASGYLYNWAGVGYSDLATFQKETGQGRMDLLSADAGPTENSATIDSADANAPGELATDNYGRPRVQDPLVPDSGTGVGYYDRGAIEFQDPFSSYRPSESPDRTEVGYPITITAQDWNPWGDTVTRTYDFGDGSPVVSSTAGSVQHTYTAKPSGTNPYFPITVTEAGQSYSLAAEIDPPGPLVDQFSVSEPNSASPMSVTVQDNSTSPFTIRTCTMNFGDGTPLVTQAGSCIALVHTYRKPGRYTVTDTETDFGGQKAGASTKASVGPVFVPLAPTRILDTRAGLGAPKGPLGSGSVVRLRVSGAKGIGNATSVLLNVTVAGPTGNGFVTAYPDGTKRPTASVLNYHPGHTVANLVDVPVGTDGMVDLYSSAGRLGLVADVEGYDTLTPGSTGAVLMNDVATWGEFRPVLDTQGGHDLPRLGKVGAGQSVTFTALMANNRSTYEYGASAVVLDVTETHATKGSYVTAYRPGSAVPTASNLNFSAGETRSAMVVVPVSPSGQVSLYNNSGSVDLSASVEGFYLPFGPDIDPVNKPMTTISPARVLDTRYGIGARKGPITATTSLRFKVAGLTGIPADATSVMLNLTAVTPTANGYLSACGDATFLTSSPAISFMRGQVTPVLTYLPISHGYVSLYNPYGSVNVVADVEGYSTN